MALPRALLESISEDAPGARARVAELLREARLPAGEETVELGALLSEAYPALGHSIASHPEDLVFVARSGVKVRRDARAYRRAAALLASDLTDLPAVRKGLRVLARREKMRIAARELLLTVGDVDVTARELSDLADSCIEVALTEALAWADARFGIPTVSTGARCAFAVLGMGKLGGRELNAGSDVDLLLFYETDEGEVLRGGVAQELTLHEYFTRVTQRLTATLDDTTEDGVVWRVDLRLRPEGARGALVNALAAAERYYETWGRTWERAALVRARPVAGEPDFGARVLSALSPFVWRRVVNPQIAGEMASLVVRARAELSSDPERDLKHGVGGIREAEFFVQSLQLVWGGRDPQLRSANTLDALRRLRARGFVTDREAREVHDAYLALRRVEHRVQVARGIQTHELPVGELLETIARSLGFTSGRELVLDLDRIRARVAERLASIVGQSGEQASNPELERFFAALDEGEEQRVQECLPSNFPATPDLARHLLALAKRPDDPLGATTRDRYPELAAATVQALSDAAFPEQATRLLGAFFLRLRTPSVYVRALAEDVRVLHRLVGLFGASAFLGGALTGHPELVDRLLFAQGAPTCAMAREAILEELAQPPRTGDEVEEPIEALVGALRRAKGRVTMEVGLADLSGELSPRGAQLVLSALAEATLEHATRAAMAERGITGGLAVIGMGKLGGREIGYGSDLDIFFVYEAPEDDDLTERFVRTAQRVLRLVSTPHGDGPGYELDTRLRPSGNHGLLVVSLESFIRYHTGEGGEAQAADWERQALLRARFVAGDPTLGARVIETARSLAYGRGAPPAARMHHLRMRMERELGRERSGEGRARHDIKVGYGGLVDIEFAAQYLQMKHGQDPRVHTTETETALSALHTCGYLDGLTAEVLREGYKALRRMEQALRVTQGTSATVIEEGSPLVTMLARRLGMRDGPRGTAAQALLTHYRALTRDVRSAYLGVLGLEPPPESLAPRSMVLH